jgi:hypothetical protein
VSTLVRRVFAGHPYRIAGAAVAGLVGLAAFWYLASPLWTRTYADEAAPTTPAQTASATAEATAAATGSAAPSGPRVLAMGQLRFVRFEDVAITNAPDIHVYLSHDAGGKWAEATSLYLGPLKATNGSFNYDVPADADVSSYKSVVVWCRAFSVLITWADLF